jgi:2',3'-cyclic-nucleotide 2'-phosphodiesterase (5'-nucleotidase family)
MIKKWIFAAGAGVGYILGTRAGRQKYDAMVGRAREVMQRPDVKEATEAIQAQANRLYDEGRQVVRERVRDLRARAEGGRDHDARPGLGQEATYVPGTQPVPPAELKPLNERH